MIVRRGAVLGLFLCLSCFTLRPLRAGAVDKARPVRVLFIGNSYTYFNNLPEMFAKLARAGGRGTVETVMAAPGGWRLKDHWEKGETRRILGEGRFDFVVLQEQSLLGTNLYLDGRARVGSDEAFRPVAVRWAAEIQAAGAVAVFFLTWARETVPEDQAALDRVYLRAGAESRSKVAPVGLAWTEVLKGHPDIGLYFDDGSHPSPAGSYLAACTIYATVFDRNPGGLPARIEGHGVDPDTGNIESGKTRVLVDLPRGQAKILQAAAWSARRRLDEKGASVDIPPWPAPALPALPEGEALSAAALEGTWTGEMLFYPLGPVRLALTLKREGEAWHGHLEIKYGSESLADESLDLKNLRVGDRILTFEDPRSPGVANLAVSFTAVCPAADEMRGTAAASHQRSDGPVQLLGIWRLRRARP